MESEGCVIIPQSSLMSSTLQSCCAAWCCEGPVMSNPINSWYSFLSEVHILKWEILWIVPFLQPMQYYLNDDKLQPWSPWRFNRKKQKPTEHQKMHKMCFVRQREGIGRKDSTQPALNAACHACDNYAERSSITASCAPLRMQSIFQLTNDPRLRSFNNGLKNQINIGQLKFFCCCCYIADNITFTKGGWLPLLSNCPICDIRECFGLQQRHV